MVDDTVENSLIGLVGPLCSLDVAALGLGLPTAEVTARAGVIVIPVGDELATPLRQFDVVDSRPVLLDGLVQFVRALASHDSWTVAVLALAITADELDGRTAVAAARAGDIAQLEAFAQVVNSEWSSGGEHDAPDDRVTRTLAGLESYDSLPRALQAQVRRIWDIRADALRGGLDFSEEYVDDVAAEADSQGRVVWRHPDQNRPVRVPHLIVDLTTYGDASEFTTPVPRHLVGQLHAGDPVVVSDDSVDARAMWVLQAFDGGRTVRVTSHRPAAQP